MQNQDSRSLDEELKGVNSPEYFKDKSKKWQKFVAQVSYYVHQQYPAICCNFKSYNKLGWF